MLQGKWVNKLGNHNSYSIDGLFTSTADFEIRKIPVTFTSATVRIRSSRKRGKRYQKLHTPSGKDINTDGLRIITGSIKTAGFFFLVATWFSVIRVQHILWGMAVF